MAGSPCPRCGSDQVLNDQCVKCGIVISKYRPERTQPSTPVSFVAAPPVDLPAPGYSIPASVLEVQKARERSRQRARIVTALVIFALLATLYMTYRFFERRASHYSGMYKNGNLLFVLKFPEQDSRWYHYREGEPDVALYKGVKDAFYRGDDADEPEVVIGVFLDHLGAQPERFPADMVSRIQTQTEDALMKMMSDNGVDCTITKSELIHPGENDGFRLEADVQVDGNPMKMIAVRAFHVDHAFWFIASGTQEAMENNAAEVNGLLGTISFRMSII